MRAAIFVEQNGDLVVEDVKPADPGPRDVLVQVERVVEAAIREEHPLLKLEK